MAPRPMSRRERDENTFLKSGCNIRTHLLCERRLDSSLNFVEIWARGGANVELTVERLNLTTRRTCEGHSNGWAKGWARCPGRQCVTSPFVDLGLVGTRATLHWRTANRYAVAHSEFVVSGRGRECSALGMAGGTNVKLFYPDIVGLRVSSRL